MMKLAICDDNQLAIQHLKDIIYQHAQEKGYVFTITTFSNSNELLGAIRLGLTFDFYFLDIMMPAVSGMDLAHLIRSRDESSSIIFVTASAEYALASYDVEAFSYLLKPIDPEKLATILDKLILNKKSSIGDGIFIKDKGTRRLLPYYSIECVEVQKDKLFYSLNTGETIECYGTLKDIEKKLLFYPQFTKPHRSYLVNMSYIAKVDAKEIHLSDRSIPVPISQGNLNNFKVQYTKFLKESLKQD